jgi:hypothetical protein
MRTVAYAPSGVSVDRPIAYGDIVDAGPNRLDDARPFIA